jgi:uncharacterized membrane protein YccF (DUF307 family)
MLCLAKNSLTLRVAWHAWPTVVGQKPGTGRPFVRPFPNDKLNSSAISLIIKCWFPWITALTWSTVSLVRTVDGWPVCESTSMDMQPFLNQVYHSNVLDQLNTVSVNACCCISYVSVAILSSLWQNLMQTCCSINTSISQFDGETNMIALQINSLMTESSCHPLLWYMVSGVAKYPT